MTTGSALIGRMLGGRFRVTGFIGEGAMACVFRGEQADEPREVAIKIMHPHLLTDRTFVGRFRREAKAAAQIRHPNSVTILDTGVDDKMLYIAMELLAGQDLFEVLAIERRFSEARAAKILIQMCAALGAAHERGIVHRDLKPENVMLLRDAARPDDERVKVLDFGIAKILERDVAEIDGAPLSGNSLTALTNVGMVVGTPAYMSPEQCRGENVDARSDVYACGILLYQLVTGRLPFAGNNAMDYAVMHVRTQPTPPHEVVPRVHVELEALLLKALGKWPTMRQQSAGELGAELERLLPELSEKPFEDARISVGPLSLTSSEPNLKRTQTPEPATQRRLAEPPEDIYRTLPSERRTAEASRASRADTLEAPAVTARRLDAAREASSQPAVGRGSDVTITLRPEAPADATVGAGRAPAISEPPPSSFEVFDRVDDQDGDEATRRNRLPDAAELLEGSKALPVAEEDAPTPLSRPISTSARPAAEPSHAMPPPKRAEEPPKPSRQLAARPAARKVTRRDDPRAWLVVPLALAIGLALGTALYFLIR